MSVQGLVGLILRYDILWYIHPSCPQFLPRACKRSCLRPASVSPLPAFILKKKDSEPPAKMLLAAFKKKKNRCMERKNRGNRRLEPRCPNAGRFHFWCVPRVSIRRSVAALSRSAADLGTCAYRPLKTPYTGVFRFSEVLRFFYVSTYGFTYQLKY
jgi:hypothetical protein